MICANTWQRNKEVKAIFIKNELNGPQLRAVTTLEGPVLIIAGAGSGKTRVITYRIARMLEKGIPQSAILALTFTNKAARELQNRLKELTGKKLQNLTVSTFHAFGVKILREEIEVLGYRKNFSIYDETDRTELIKESLRECKVSSEKMDLYSLGQLFSNIKIGRMKWGQLDGTGTYADSSLEPVYAEYEKSLKIFNALDFDDLLVIPIKLFSKFPDILEKYRKRYRYFLVDEFQDTSLIQYQLLKMLAERKGEEKANLCVVGDDDQSIYSWRGASYENLIRFEKDFPGTTEIKLEQNYRSTTTILEAANGVISHNTHRKEKKLWTGSGGGRPIEMYYPANESDEAEFIASRIKEIRLIDNLKYDDFGVLIRTNSQIDCIEEAFLAENIPCKISGGMSFFERKEIKDVLSYLRVIANPYDEINLLRIINTPRRGIGKNTVALLSDLARKNHTGIWDSMNFLGQEKDHGQEKLFHEKGGKGEIEGFIELIEGLREEMVGKKGLSGKVRAMVDRINYWAYLVSEYSKDEKKARWKFANINYLLQMMEAWEQDPDNLDPTLYAYLNRISLLTRTDNEEDEEKGKVNLMTIHASKGLEFPVVFIAGAEDGFIPHERSLEESGVNDMNPLEEERRLFYVAITRARDKLLITSCQRRTRFQTVLERKPSPFLLEIPSPLVEYHDQDEKNSSDAGENFFAKMRERFGTSKNGS